MEQDEFDLKIKQDFISEALEMLGWVEDQFLIFEQNPSDSKVVDEIFRMAHTVKGSAMTCGFVRLGEFAHVMETLLVNIREGKHTPDSESVDVLLRANDTLRAYLELLRTDFDAVLDTEAMKEDLMYFIGEEVKSGSAPAMSFGFFDDDDSDTESTAVVAPSPAATSTTFKPDATEVAPFSSGVFDEMSYLTLKAFLDLSNDSSPDGIDSCLKTLEQALKELTKLRRS